jgi:IclR family acetate operon transcriptional repressor
MNANSLKAPMKDSNKAGRIKSVHRLSDIIELLRQQAPVTTTVVADELGVAKSTAHAYLSSMYDLEYVVKDTEGYSLSLKFLDYGMEVRDQLPITEIGETTLEQLASDTNEATYIVVEEHGIGVYVNYSLGERAVRTHAGIGTRRPLHSLASGKSILAYLPEKRVKEIIEMHGLTKRTNQTITSPENLYDDLESIRERGYALSEQETFNGIRAIGAPVVVNEAVIGAISVAGPENRITKEHLEDEIIGEILAAANEIELKLAQQARS